MLLYQCYCLPNMGKYNEISYIVSKTHTQKNLSWIIEFGWSHCCISRMTLLFNMSKKLLWFEEGWRKVHAIYFEIEKNNLVAKRIIQSSYEIELVDILLNIFLPFKKSVISSKTALIMKGTWENLLCTHPKRSLDLHTTEIYNLHSCVL